MTPLQAAIQELDQEIKDCLAEKNAQIAALILERDKWRDLAKRSVPFVKRAIIVLNDKSLYEEAMDADSLVTEIETTSE